MPDVREEVRVKSPWTQVRDRILQQMEAEVAAMDAEMAAFEERVQASAEYTKVKAEYERARRNLRQLTEAAFLAQVTTRRAFLAKKDRSTTWGGLPGPEITRVIKKVRGPKRLTRGAIADVADRALRQMWDESPDAQALEQEVGHWSDKANLLSETLTEMVKYPAELAEKRNRIYNSVLELRGWSEKTKVDRRVAKLETAAGYRDAEEVDRLVQATKADPEFRVRFKQAVLEALEGKRT